MKQTSIPQQVAAVDLGSNSFHMIVAHIESDGQLRVIDRLKEMVRLRGGLDEFNQLTPQAQERALECLRRFGQRVRNFPLGSVRALGTNTLRVARNAEEFLALASAALGHPIDIIGGREEARLVYLGVAHTIAPSGERRLVVDIGGGSTELIIGEGFEALQTESLHLGCVSVSMRFFPDGKLTAKAWDRAVTFSRQELQPYVGRFDAHNWRRALGASGTISTTEKVIRENGWGDGAGITPEGLEALRKALLAAGEVERLSLSGLSKERAPVFAGGVAVLTALFEGLGIERMEVAQGALREGALYDLLGRIHHEDIRARSIRAFADRFHIDLAQAERVSRLAKRFFDSVADAWDLGADDRDYLLWAAQLHEVGQSVAHSGYHKHGQYLVGNADLPGFSRHEQEILAVLVRTHRRKFNLKLFASLPPASRRRTIRLAALLRLAVVFQRGRNDDEKPAELSVENGSLKVGLPEEWLASRPLTRVDIESEQEAFRQVKIDLLLV